MGNKKSGIPEGVASALAEIGECKSQLDGLDTRLSEQIRSFEDGLRSLRLGVRLFVLVDDDEDEPAYLVFTKYQGQWRLLVEEVPRDRLESALTPLSDCPRDFRAQAVEIHIPALLAAAAQQLKDRIAERERVLFQGGTLLAALAEAKEAKK